MKYSDFLTTRRRITSWLLMPGMAAYLFVCCILFFQWIEPSLDGRTNQHIAADSGTYIYMADVLREGRNDPLVVAALSSFPNTFWMPVLFALALKTTFLMALANLFLFWLSIRLFARSSNISAGVFVLLLLLNPTTTISLLSVNKEIVDMFAVALFCYFLSSHQRWILGSALIISAVNRYEVCVTFLMFLLIRSRVNPWRKRRFTTLIILVLIMDICLPLLASHTLSERFSEASGAGLVAILDTLEMHYMFALAVIPKILENMLGEVLNISHWNQYDLSDPANSYILFFNNFASLTVILLLAAKRSIKISSDWIYLSFTAAVFMAVSLVNQPRYFYLCYVLFCLQAAHSGRIPHRRLHPAQTGDVIAHR